MTVEVNAGLGQAWCRALPKRQRGRQRAVVEVSVKTGTNLAKLLEAILLFVSGIGEVAGCMVTEGIVRRGAGARLLRGAVLIHDGKIRTLRRFEDDASEVKAGYECGIALARTDQAIGARLRPISSTA